MGEKRIKPEPSNVAPKKAKFVKSEPKEAKEPKFRERQNLIKEMNKLTTKIHLAETEGQRFEAATTLLKYVTALKYRTSHSTDEALLMKAHNPQISRALQLLVRKGTAPQKEYIITTLAPDFSKLIHVPYASKLALTLYRHATDDQREQLASQLNKPKLFFTKSGGELWDAVYRKAPPKSKIQMLNRLALPKFVRVKYSQLLEHKLETIFWKIEESSDRDALRDYMETVIDKCVNKELLHTEISHALLRAFIACVDDSTGISLEGLMGKIAEGSHALLPSGNGKKDQRDGAVALARLIGHGTPAQKKRLAKTLKPNVIDHCQDPKVYFFIMRLLDVTDDTKLLNDCFVKRICEDFLNVVENLKGQRVVLSLISRNEVERKRHLDGFEKSIMDYESKTAKKDFLKKRQEFIPRICEAVKKILSEKSLADLLFSCGPVIRECFFECDEEVHIAFTEMIKEELKKLPTEENVPILDDPAVSKMIVTILREDASKEKKVVNNLAKELLKLKTPVLASLMKRRAIFFVVEALDSDEGKNLKLKIGKDFSKFLENSTEDSPFLSAGKNAIRRKLSQ